VTAPDAGPARPSRGPLVALLVAAVAATAVLVVLAVRSNGSETGSAPADAASGPFRAGRLPDGVLGRPAPAFRLPDARGGWLDTDELRGRPYVVTFLYTDCRDVCPLIGQELGRALKLLDRRASEVTVAAVSVDPEGDTPEAVRLWLRRLRLPSNFHYLVGTEAELRPVWDSYFAAPQEPGADESLHTASIWLIDRRGRWRAKFSGGIPVPPDDIAHDLRVLLRERLS
jgi:protein SCO1/2